MKLYNGIYKNGIVRFPGPVDIPEGGQVTVAVIDASPTQPPLGCNSPKLYEILRHSYDTGETDLAAATTNTSRSELAFPCPRKV